MDKGRVRTAGTPRNCIESAPQGLRLQPEVNGGDSLKADIYATSLSDFNSKVDFNLARGRFLIGCAGQSGVAGGCRFACPGKSAGASRKHVSQLRH